MRGIIPKAATFAANMHFGQRRKFTDEPYICHPLRVAGTVSTILWATDEMVAAAWLHDVVEDCNCDIRKIEDEFGKHVARYVWGLTNPSQVDPHYNGEIGKRPNRKTRKDIDNAALSTQPAEVKIIKLCDVADNVGDIAQCQDGFKYIFCREKLEQIKYLEYCHSARPFVEIIKKRCQQILDFED